jgi:mRNA interferase MazF
MVSGYTPTQGDIIWMNFDPQLGHEQMGRRPALVVSGAAFNKFTKTLAVVCPITSTKRGVPTHVPLDSGAKTAGVVMCEQVKSLDLSVRNVEFIEKASKETVKYIIHVIGLFFDGDK